MAPILKVLLKLLRTIRFARDYIKRFPRCAGSLLALLGRKLNVCWRFCFGKSGSIGRPKPADRPFLGTEASSYSVSGGSAVVREYVVAASSTVPVSASRPSLYERTETQPAISGQSIGVHPSLVANPSVDRLHAPNSSQPLGGKGLVNRSSRSPSGVNIQSRASDRFSIITNSQESTGAPSGQPSRLFRETHPQVGGGPDRSPREGATGPHTPPHASDLKIVMPSPTHVDDKVRRQDVPNPLTELLPISSSTNPQQLTNHPFAIDSARVHSAVDRHDGPLQVFSTSFNSAKLDHFVPEGRFVQLIDSEQIPRYTRDIKMQVGNTISSLHPYISLQTPCGDNFLRETVNNHIPLVCYNFE
jgi:hypothetical protein